MSRTHYFLKAVGGDVGLELQVTDPKAEVGDSKAKKSDKCWKQRGLNGGRWG